MARSAIGVEDGWAGNFRISARAPEQYKNQKFARAIWWLRGSIGERVFSQAFHAGGRSMSGAYSNDLRVRVIDAVEAGASRREAAERFEISVSSAIRWLRRWREAGSAEAKPRGGSCSPLEEHKSWLLGLIKEQPDLTLEEIVAAMHKERIAGSRTAIWRFFVRHEISFKKNAARKRANPG